MKHCYYYNKQGFNKEQKTDLLIKLTNRSTKLKLLYTETTLKTIASLAIAITQKLLGW